jgi:tetratricopeptide (TPR) repeat protein
MRVIPLRLVPLRHPCGPAVAGVIAGPDPEHWRAVLDALPGGETLSLLPLPVRPGEGGCGGVLVFANPPRLLPSVAGLHPYRLAHGKVFLPAHAELSLALRAEEVDAVFTGQWQVFHPALGVIAFGNNDCLTPGDLLAPLPERREARWNAAIPGPRPPPLPRRILLARPPAADDVLAGLKGDIAREEPTRLPPGAAEGGPWRARWQRLEEGLARRLLALLARLPVGARGAAWQERLARRLTRQVEMLVTERAVELKRLLEMLRRDPDEALQYAVPLRTEADHRGRAPASGSLARNLPDFDLHRLGGQRSGGNWTVDGRTFRDLQTAYRQAASRELALGRFGRAAYIFGHLLHDFHAAANALEQGERFREAAVVYRERLESPRRAVECLEAGGLLLEAAELRVVLGELEAAGDLYRRAGDEAHARALFEDALAKEPSVAEQGRLLFERLGREAEALERLGAGWPEGPEAVDCQRAEFRYRDRLGDVEGLRRMLRGLARPGGRVSPVRAQVEVLGEVAGALGDSEIRRWARDLALGCAGEALRAGLAADERERLLALLPGLLPQDAQFARDVRDYAARGATVARRPSRGGLGVVLEPLRSFALTRDFACQGMAPFPGGLVAWGRSSAGEAGWSCLRADWESPTVQRAFWAESGGGGRLLGLFGPRRHFLLLAPTTGRLERWHRFGYAPWRPPAFEAGTPSWWPDGVAAVGEVEGSTLSLVRHAGAALILGTYSVQGRLLREVPFGGGAIDPRAPTWMFTRHGIHYLVLGPMAVAATGVPETSTQVNFDSPVEAACASFPHQTLRLAVTTQGGTRLFHPRRQWASVELGRRQGAGPVASTFTANGGLVLVEDREGQVFRTGQGAERVARFTLPVESGAVAGVVAGLGPGAPGFAVLTTRGTLWLYPPMA